MSYPSHLFPFHGVVLIFRSATVFLTTIPVIFRDNYHEGPGVGGLHYIALGVGLSGASQLNARFMDRIYIHYKKRNNGVGEPEFRLRELFGKSD